MVATSFDLSQIRSDVTAYSSSFRNLIGLGSSATLNAASANGVATLDGTGKLSAAQIPDISLVSYLGSVASQAAMLALSGQQGDWCVRSDLSTTWVITGANPTQLSSWTQLSYPAVPVQSVFGRTGAVVGVSTDYSAVGIDSTAIGAVTPSTGAFTTLTSSSDATLNGILTVNPSVTGAYALKTLGSTAGGYYLNIQAGGPHSQFITLTPRGTNNTCTFASSNIFSFQSAVQLTSYLTFDSASNGASTDGPKLSRDAANVLAQSNSTSAQTLRLYGTYAGADYRRLYMSSTTAGAFTIGVEGGGTGASGNTLELQTGGTTALSLDASGNVTIPKYGASYPSFKMMANSSTAGLSINTGSSGEVSLSSHSNLSLAANYGNFSLYAGYGTRLQIGDVIRFTLDAGVNIRNSANTADAPITASRATLSTGTITASTPAVDISQTWNSSGVTFTGSKINITDTASASGSLLADWQVGGVSKASISKSSKLTLGIAPTSTNYAIWGDGTNTWINSTVTNSYVHVGAADNWGVAVTGSQYTGGLSLRLDATAFIGWSAGAPSGASTLSIYRDASDVLAQRRTTNAQAFRTYNTFTDASNYERGVLDWSTTSNVFRIGTEAAGTGTVRNIALVGGNVGIGTTSPAQALHIVKDQGLAVFNLDSYNAGPNNRSILFFRTATGSVASPGNVASGQNIGEFVGAGYAGGSFQNAASMDFYVGTGTVSGSSLPSYISFSTTPNGSVTRTERLRVDQNGNVGIGTTSPTHNLVVGNDLGDVSPGKVIVVGNTAGNSVVAVGQGANNGFAMRWVYNATAANASGRFNTTGYANPMYFDASAIAFQSINAGNFGIGQGTPAAKLDILDTTSAGSGSLAASTLNIASTWNTTGTPTAVKLNITDTASNSASMLIDLQVGGSRRFGIDKTGWIQIRENAYSGIVFADINNNRRLVVTNSILYAPTTITLASAGDPFTNNDVQLSRDAANTLAQRNGGNGQTFRIYNTYTDASNYRRLAISSTTAGAFTISAEGAGTGASGNTLTIGNDLIIPSLSRTNGFRIFDAPAGYHVFYDGQDYRGLTVSHTNYDPDTSAFISNSRNVNVVQGALAFGDGTYWVSDVVLKRTSANTISVLRGNFSTPGNFVSGTTSITPASLSGSSATSALDISHTWNTTGTPTLIKANVTDTASNASSLFADFQISSAPRLTFLKTGGIRSYNSSDSSLSNYERGKFIWESNILRIGTEKAGTGSARALELQTDGTTRLTLGATGISTIASLNIGSGTFANDGGIPLEILGNNTYIGFYVKNTDSSGSKRIGIGVGGSAAPVSEWTSRAYIEDQTGNGLSLGCENGHVRIYGKRGSNALFVMSTGLVSFAGMTSSFPAIKRNGTAVNFRLADDSADCDITAAALTLSGNLTISTKNIVTDTSTGTKIGTATTQKLGFYNATPVVQPTAVADATDAASVITQLNALLSRMRDLGLIAT